MNLNTKENTMKPKLRFPEFSGEWKEKRLGELDLYISDGNYGEMYPKASQIRKEGVPFIRANNIIESKLSWKDMKYIEPRLHNELKSGHLLTDDILITTRGDIGEVASVDKEFEGSNINAQLCLLRNKYSINTQKYLYYYLNTRKGKSQLRQLQTGSALKQLPKGNLKKILISLPGENEQQKIADFLAAVDERIEKLERKVELLEQYKKGAMQSIFSQRVRFKDYDDSNYPEWKEKKLEEIASLYSGGTPKSTIPDFYQGDIPFIKSGEINADRTEQYVNERALRNSSAKLIEKGNILYALYGATSGEVAISKISGAINQAILCIKPDINKVFVYFKLFTEKDRIIKKYLQGGQGNLSANIIKKLEIPIATQEEQQKIADFLTAIDDKIELTNKELKQAKQFKHGLLQQMFV